jgi:hypothetical protein
MPKVVAISASVGGPATIVIQPRNAPDRERVTTSRLVIVQSLVPALLTGARPVNIDRVEGSNVVRRVQAYSLGVGLAKVVFGDYRVSRIATQRMPNGEDEHLEVFVTKRGEKEEKAYNVYDPMLQALLIAAFQANEKNLPEWSVDLQLDGNDIVTVTLGEKVDFKN